MVTRNTVAVVYSSRSQCLELRAQSPSPWFDNPKALYTLFERSLIRQGGFRRDLDCGLKRSCMDDYTSAPIFLPDF